MTQTKTAPASQMAKIISRKVEFEGWHRLETIVAEPKSLKHDGWAAHVDREVFFGKKIVSVLLYAPKTDEILFNQQFRMGAFMAGAQDPFLLECCAGAVDDGEDFEAAARREALEETGSEITDMKYVGNCFTSPGCMAEEFHLYVGRIEDPKVGIHGIEEEAEEIKTHLLPVSEAMRLLDAGKITNVTTALLLHWFARHGADLKKEWAK